MRASCVLSCDKKSRPVGASLQLFACALLCSLAALQVFGQARQRPSHPASPPRTQQQPATENPMHEAKLEVPDVWVTTQDGERLRFYTDLVKGRKVAVGFFYTTCLYICTRHGEFFARLQNTLQERLGKDVFLISVTIDPLTDTPAKLKRWGETYGRRPGWTLLTGSPADLGPLLKVFTGNTPGPRDDHSSFFYLADGQSGRWHFADTLVAPSAVVERLDATRPVQPKPDIFSVAKP